MATGTRSKNKAKARAASPRLANARRASAARARSSADRASAELAFNAAPAESISFDDDGRPFHEVTTRDANRTLIDDGHRTETVLCVTRTYLDDNNALPKIIRKSKAVREVETTEVIFGDEVAAAVAAAATKETEHFDPFAMDVSEPYDSDMDPPASLLHKKAIAKFSRFLTISRFFADTEEEIQARIRARLALEEAQQALEEARSMQKAPTLVAPAAAPLVSKVAPPPPKASVSLSKAPAPVLNVSTPALKNPSPAQNTIPATPSHATAASLTGVTAASSAPGVPRAANMAAGSGTHAAADTTFTAASGAEQQGSKAPRVAKAPTLTAGPSTPSASAPVYGSSIILPSYPSAKNGYRGGPVLRTCKRPLSGKNIYIEISDDSEDN